MTDIVTLKVRPEYVVLHSAPCYQSWHAICRVPLLTSVHIIFWISHFDGVAVNTETLFESYLRSHKWLHNTVQLCGTTSMQLSYKHPSTYVELRTDRKWL